MLGMKYGVLAVHMLLAGAVMAAPATSVAGQPADAPGTAWLQVEIPAGSAIKYEVDTAGRLFVDRFLPGAEVYPANYGGLPGTLAGDGDPLDALVITRQPLPPGVHIAFRPIGVLHMVDAGRSDQKLIGVPVAGVDADYRHIHELDQLPASLRTRIAGFFAGYKAGQAGGNPVRLDGWGNAASARALLVRAIAAGSTGLDH